MIRFFVTSALVMALATPAFAQGGTNNTAIGLGQASSNASASALGVGNNFGNQSVRNTNSFSPTSTNSVSSRNNVTVVNDITNSNTSSNSQNQSQKNGHGSGSNGGWHSHGNGGGSNRLGNGLTGGNFAPSVYAPGLAQSSGQNCASSISFGVSGPGAGLSFGFPFQGTGSERCDARLSADMFRSLGLRQAAVQRMCESEADGMALAAAGVRCRVGHYAQK